MSTGNYNLGGRTITGLAQGAAGKMGAIVRGAGAITGMDALVGYQQSFNTPLQSSLIPAIWAGDATPTFTRATTASVWGYGPTAVLGVDDPVLLTVASGEARFVGARRISEGVWSGVDANGVALTTTNGASASYGDASGPFGYLPEGARTQYLGVTGTPATQTTASLGTGTYTLWIADGDTGSATSSAGTATITGGGAATDGSPNVFTVTGAGTVTVTVAGSVSLFQLENGGFRSSYIANAGAAGTSVTRNADVLTYPYSGNANNALGSMYVEFAASNWTAIGAGQNRLLGFDGSGGIILNATYTGIQIYDGSTVVNGPSGTPSGVMKFAASWGGSSMQAFANGSAGTAGSFDGTMGAATAITISGSAERVYGTIRNVRIYPQALSAAKQQAMTT